MRVLQLRRNLDLSAEAVAIHAGSELRRQHFDDDISAKHTIDRDEDAAHAASRQLSIELIIGPQRILEVLSEFCHRDIKETLTSHRFVGCSFVRGIGLSYHHGLDRLWR